MPLKLPDYYFRIRENGAAVFRVDSENRQRRMEMDQIAIVNTRNGEVKAQGDKALSDADKAAIKSWLADRQQLLARRETDDILRTVDHLNLTAQWAQSRATDAQLEEVTGALLMAMHDLRSTLIRRRADKLDQRAPRAPQQGAGSAA